MWLEDPMPPDFSESWVRLRSASKVPIGMGENLARRHGFKDFIINQGCDIVQLDVRNTGGLLESKKISDLADLFYLPMAAHDTGSVVCNIATVHWAASVRDFLAAETMIGEAILGRMCTTIMRQAPTPVTRAARTYSRSRTDNTCPCASRAKVGTETTPTAIITLLMPAIGRPGDE